MNAAEKTILEQVRKDLRNATAKVDGLLAASVTPSPPVGPRKKIGVCVGHSRPGDSGAEAVDGTTEWSYNAALGAQLVRMLNETGYEARLFDSYEGASYGRAMNWLADQLKNFGADIAIELHFNGFNGRAKGYEYLYWHSSAAGEDLARAFHTSHKATYPLASSRGIKSRDTSDRGALFLQGTHCPSIILEPFFGDNQEDWNRYGDGQTKLAQMYARAISQYFTHA